MGNDARWSPDPQRIAADALVASAAASGVRTIWFTSGSELVPLQEATAKADALGLPSPRIVTAIHEHVGMCMAMGESMTVGRPSCVAAHADLGLLNFGGAIHNAAVGGYPLLVLTGYPATSAAERTESVYWKQQRRDQGEIVRQYVKWDYRPGTHEELGVVTARALQVCLSPPQGPVYLAAPSEVLSRRLEEPPVVLSAQDLGVPVLGGGPAGAVTEIARRMLGAESPVVLTDRVGRNPAAVRMLAELAEEFGIAVRATRHRMNLSDDSPASAPFSLDGCDAVLVLDHPVPWLPTVENPRPDAFVAVVGEDPAATSIPLYEFRATHRVAADVGLFLEGLLEAMRRLRSPSQRERHRARWADLTRRKAESLERRARQIERDRRVGVPTPLTVAAAVGGVMGPDDLFAWELADAGAVHRSRPGTMFDKGGSSLGWAVAALIGARYVEPDRPAVCLTGDGSYIFGVTQALLWTQQHLGAPVLTVVCNNRGYRTGTQTLVSRYPHGFAANAGTFAGGQFDPPPDYAAEAEAAGGYGARVVSLSELDDALAAARKATETDRRPAVVDVWLPAHVTGAHPMRPRSS